MRLNFVGSCLVYVLYMVYANKYSKTPEDGKVPDRNMSG
jgi:hypothetical protein